MKYPLILRVCSDADLRQYLEALGEVRENLLLFLVPASSRIQLNGSVPKGVVLLGSLGKNRKWKITDFGSRCQLVSNDLRFCTIKYTYCPNPEQVSQLIVGLDKGDFCGAYLEGTVPSTVGLIAREIAKLHQPKQL